MSRELLIERLSINRDGHPQPEVRPRRARWYLSTVVALGVLAAGGWLGWRSMAATTVSVEEVQPAQSGAQVDSASVLDASGYVVAQRQATVASKTIGRITELLIEEGQHVRAGQVIARLDSSNTEAALAQASAQASAAASAREVALVRASSSSRRLERNQKLYNQGYLSDQALDDAKAEADEADKSVVAADRAAQAAAGGARVARQAVDDDVIRAPFSGVVTVKAAQPGEIVSPTSSGGFTRTGICTIVDMDSLEVDVDIAENVINRIEPGMAATVTLNAYPDWRIQGAVIAVVPTADRSKATVSVRVSLPEKDARIVPEMGARVAFHRAETTARPTAPALTVPAAAVHSDGPQDIVFVVKEGRAVRRAVRVGARSGERQLILSGLTLGEQVAVVSSKPLTDGKRVHVEASSLK
ncbi:efflux RND transporter periplasmic adaptor subunit [Caulobacter sp. KR2-114]|uniref:efflux RND transporter periplasmic adaptor subunit n=1 Tax=Caulobacter sp. KR2-114 TaxID=3400912 RepID=UPI003C03B54B